MAITAIAGGTGHIGRTILDVLSEDPEHRIIVLSRTENKKAENGAEIIVVDYKDVAALQAVLEAHSVDTVISCLMILDDEAGKAEINLIRAAAASSSTKRIIVSDYGLPYPAEAVKDFPHTGWRVQGFEEAKKTDLQVTRFWNGLWLDYFASPQLKSYMREPPYALDIANRMAGIPGDGNQPIVFTYSYDVARFVKALLKKTEWPETSIVIGEKLTWNEFLRKAEDARGAKFEVHYDNLDKLKTHHITELPSHHELYAHVPKESIQRTFSAIGQWMVNGAFNLPEQNTLNQMFPDIHTMTVESMLEQCWKAR